MRRIAIAELARHLHRRAAVHRSLAMVWKAYFDESGTEQQNQTVAYAGYVGTEVTWQSVEIQWDAVLEPYTRQYGIKTFHMADCVGDEGFGEFRNVPRAVRHDIIRQFRKIIDSSDLISFYSGVDNAEWNACVKDADFLKVYPSPVYLCFDHIIRELHRWSQSYANGEMIAPVFAEADAYSEKMKALYDAYLASRWRPNFVGTFTTSSPTILTPLQAADMVAWEWSKFIEAQIYGTTPYYNTWHEERQNLTYLTRFKQGAWFDEESLLRTVEQFKLGNDDAF